MWELSRAISKRTLWISPIRSIAVGADSMASDTEACWFSLNNNFRASKPRPLPHTHPALLTVHMGLGTPGEATPCKDLSSGRWASHPLPGRLPQPESRRLLLREPPSSPSLASDSVGVTGSQEHLHRLWYPARLSFSVGAILSPLTFRLSTPGRLPHWLLCSVLSSHSLDHPASCCILPAQCGHWTWLLLKVSGLSGSKREGKKS